MLDLVTAWALFRFFAPVSCWVSRLTAWLRVAFAAVFLVAVAQPTGVIGVLLVVAGAGYAFDTFSSVLSQTPVVVSTVTFVGELVLAVWLVVRGGRVQPDTSRERWAQGPTNRRPRRDQR